MKYKYCLLVLCSATLVSCGGESGGTDPVAVAGCPGFENPDPTNTDGDLLLNVCDPDDDGDGFLVGDDPAPLDPAIPGDFSTPEAILNNDAIATALAEAEAAGFPVATETGLNPPDLTGFYIRGDTTGNFPVNSSGTEQGRGWVGGESRIEQFQDNTIESAGVTFTDGQPISFGFDEGTIIRGEGNRYTSYARGSGTCTEQGSDYETFVVSVQSAEVNAITGDIENFRSISTTVDVAGELTTACADRLVGLSELTGSWTVAEVAIVNKVVPAQMSFMCVSGEQAYAPTESWIDMDGLSCSCTLDYQLMCM